MSTGSRNKSPGGRRQQRGIPDWGCLLLLVGCVTTTGHHGPGHYARTSDTATAGCLRNPACYTTTPGEEAIIPWLSNAASAARSAPALAMLLAEADIKLVEKTLTECAQAANEKVNQEDETLKGQEPDRAECRKVVRREGNMDVTRAMELGAKKHDKALDCAREALKALAEYVRVEPTYQKDLTTGVWRWIDPKQVKEWLQLGLTAQLWGALVPDIVIHAAGNPNKVQRVYDFKFPCPPTNKPQWGYYAPNQPHYPNTQGKMYEALGGEKGPAFSTPGGIHR